MYNRAYAEQTHQTIRERLANFAAGDPTGRGDPAVLIASSVLNAAYFLPIVYRAFFKAPPADSHPHGEAPWPIVVAIGFTALATVTFFFFPNVFIQLAPSYSRDQSGEQYLTAVEDPTATAFYGNRYVFGYIETTTVSLTTRVNWTFTPNLTLQLFAQPFTASGDYSFALVQIDAAINTVSQTRGSFGALQNRLESTISNLGSRMEKSLIGKDVAITKSATMPTAFRFMVGDASRIEVP